MTKAIPTKTHLPMTPTPMFGKIMALSNSKSYDAVLNLVDLPVQGALLEIGFGTGELLARARRKWPDASLAGIDPTPAMAELARANKYLRPKRSPIDLRLGGAEALPWPDSAFACVVAVNSFQFWNPPEQALAEIKRVLAQSGLLIIALRDHTRHAPDWLPNPISKSGDEVARLMALLINMSFANITKVSDRSGVIVTAAKP